MDQQLDLPGSPSKVKKRRRFWRLRRQRDASPSAFRLLGKESREDGEETPSAASSDGRISPQYEEDVAEILSNPSLVLNSGQWEQPKTVDQSSIKVCVYRHNISVYATYSARALTTL